jgi:acyl-CoA reductase-like NAD-dependent aldehyde dehydrogenase
MTTTEPTAPTPVGTEGDHDAHPDLDTVIAELAVGEFRWAKTSLAERIAWLDEVSAAVTNEAVHWVRVAGQVKQLDPSSSLMGEEWISGPYATLTSLTTLKHSLAAIARHESPIADRKLGTAPGGRVTVPVLPSSTYEALLLHGFTGEVWIKPGISADAVRASAGLGALDPTKTGGVGLVLGAGNITSIPPLDVLYGLIAHNRVALLKLNPVMDAMLPVYAAAFAPLIRAGVLRIVTGGGEVGSYLAHHPGVSHVHITGSAATHDAVVFGPGEEGKRRKAAGTPVLAKPITSELGGVAPIIVLPGKWTARDLRFQAEHVATQRLHNGGYNCIAGQIVVLSTSWPQRSAFLEQLRIALATAPARPPWYPGSDDRVAQASAAYPEAERLGPADSTRLLVDVRSDADASAIQTTEYFSPVLGVIELAGTGQAFLDAAVDTVNRDFVGTLGANIIGLPSTIASLGDGFDTALARLEYGTIAINAWTAVGFLSAAAPWGAFPGHTLDNVQSGIEVVHNAFLLADTERTIIRGPFRPFPRSVLHGEFALFPKPPWFVSARSAQATGRQLFEFAAHPSWAKMPGVFAAAFRA